MRLIFFSKQKTAYDMRISDWSSDVCSSDLHAEGFIGPFALQGRVAGDGTLTYFEMLTRIGGGTAGFTALGLNQSRLLVELFAGRALPDPAGTEDAGGAAVEDGPPVMNAKNNPVPEIARLPQRVEIVTMHRIGI